MSCRGHVMSCQTSKTRQDMTASFPTKASRCPGFFHVHGKCIRKIVRRFPFLASNLPFLASKTPEIHPSQHNCSKVGTLFSYQAFSRMGCLPWLCRRRPGAGWLAPAAKQLARIGRHRDMQLAEPTRWAEGVAAGAAACGEW